MRLAWTRWQNGDAGTDGEAPFGDRQTPLTSFLDLAWRTAFRLAFPLARIWWRLTRPRHEGVVVAAELRLSMPAAQYRRPGRRERRPGRQHKASVEELNRGAGSIYRPILGASMVRRPYARRRTENEPPTWLEVRATRRWREMDSNVQYAGTVNLVVASLCRSIAWDGSARRSG